jgi:hypothetical protein
MGYSFKHTGGALPITLALDEVTSTHPCPTCVRAEFDGTVTIRTDAKQTEGTTPAMCSRGHMVLVQWTRSPQTPD